MAAIDETELRFVLEGLNKEQLTSILVIKEKTISL